MKSKLKKVLSILLCVGVLLPQGAMLAFAEAEITPKQEAAPKQEVVTEKEKAETKKDEKEVETDADITVKAKGNGNIIAKLASESDKSLKNAENSDIKLNANIGDEVFIKTYAVDGNTTSFSEEGLDLVSEDKQVLSINRIYKVTENKASLTASFTGGDAEGSSRQTPKMRAAAMRAASSMSTTITKVKSQYGYDANGNGSSWYNKYTKFNATGAYNNAAYCAEHSRDLSASNLTGSVVSDSVIRKILYYGYRGPKQWSGFANSSYNGVYQLWGSENTDRTEICGTVVTAQAISDRWKAAGSGTGINCNPSGLSAFMAYVNSMPDPGSSWTVYIAKASGQDMAWGVYEPNGYLTMTKEVAENEGIVNECPEMYTLAGAEYTVKNSSGKVVGILTTKVDGSSNKLTLPVGTYTVKETKAPNGFAIDNKTYTVNVTSNQTATFTSKEVPLFDPISIVLEKVATDGSYVNINANMSNAEFTIKYYDSIGDDVSNIKPIRTWKLKTINKMENILHN